MPYDVNPLYTNCFVLNDIWCGLNDLDAAVLSGGAAAGLGVDRLKDPRLGKVWRTPTGGATLTILFATAIPIQVFGVFGVSNPAVAMTLAMGSTPGGSDIRSGTWTGSGDALTKQKLWLNRRDRGVAVAPLVREIRLGITTAGIDIGRVWASDYSWTPISAHNTASTQSFTDLSSVQRTRRSGSVLADSAAVQRLHQVDYDALTSTEWAEEVFTLQQTAGLHQQVLFVPNYTVYNVNRFSLLGYQESQNPIAAMTYDRFQTSFNLRESG
jgi:hypothetical protein